MTLNAKEFFLLDATSPVGSQILVSPDDRVFARDASIAVSDLPDGWVFVKRAEGDFDRSAWGIGQPEPETWGVIDVDTEGEWYPKRFGCPEDALEYAMDLFGLPAEIQDEIIDLVEDARCEADEKEIGNG